MLTTVFEVLSRGQLRIDLYPTEADARNYINRDKFGPSRYTVRPLTLNVIYALCHDVAEVCGPEYMPSRFFLTYEAAQRAVAQEITDGKEALGPQILCYEIEDAD